MVSPSCQRSHVSFTSAPVIAAFVGGVGIAARMSVNSRFSQGWRTALGQDVTPSIRTRPLAGWNSVSTLAVPSRRYSCGWLAGRLALGPPGRAGMGHRLERPGLIRTPDRKAHRLAREVGLLDQLFFDSASGSVTSMVPALRFRNAAPVGHQVRLCW
jgi:hypothetical protein